MGATLISKINSKKSKILLVTFILPRTIILECKVLDKIVIAFKWMPIHKNWTYCIDAHLINVLFLDTKYMGSRYIVDVLWCQPIKLIQVVSSTEFHEYWWNDFDFILSSPPFTAGPQKPETLTASKIMYENFWPKI